MSTRRRTKLVAILGIPLAWVMASSSGAAAAVTQVATPVITTSSFTYTQGIPFTATFTPGPVGVAPVSYVYTVDDKTRTVKAPDGTATVTLLLDRYDNELDVVGQAADGTKSVKAVAFLLAPPAIEGAAQDLNSDGSPDLVTLGGPAGMPKGIWLADGEPGDPASGRVKVPAVSLSLASDFGNPQFYDDDDLITGDFLGHNLQDVMVIKTSGYFAGTGLIMTGMGDGSISENAGVEISGQFTDVNGDNPLQMVNAYDSAGNHQGISDLIGISGDPVNGYALTYYQDPIGGTLIYAVESTPTATPTGGHDWNNWRLASTRVVTSPTLAAGTAVYLWNTVTGALYLWTGVTFTDEGDFGGGTLSYTQYHIADRWNVGADISTLEAADFMGDGTPDLWTVSSPGVATAYVVSNVSTSGIASVKAKEPQNLF